MIDLDLTLDQFPKMASLVDEGVAVCQLPFRRGIVEGRRQFLFEGFYDPPEGVVVELHRILGRGLNAGRRVFHPLLGKV